jgi:hypothetical protein
MIEYPRCFRPIPHALLGILAALLSTAAEPLSAASDIFEVADVEVDVTAKTAAAAREKALSDGQVAAFRQLMGRLVLVDDVNRLPMLSAVEVAPLVRDFSVANEKVSTVRYLALLTFHFKADDVRRFLVGWRLPFAETRSKPVLVLPVYQTQGALLLWDDPNPWLKAWSALPKKDSLVPLALPSGDLTDIATIGAEQAIRGDQQRLGAVALRYRTDSILVALATLGMSARSSDPELDVFVTRHGGGDETFVRSYAAGRNEGVDALLRRAASDIARQIRNTWKRENLMQFGQDAVLAATIPVTSLGHWLEIRKRLGSVAVIRKIELVLMSRDEVRVNLHYIGKTDQLTVALKQADLILDHQDATFMLGLRGSAPIPKNGVPRH